MSKLEQLQNRIVATGNASPAGLLANPKNWRTHPEFQAKSLEAILREVGWVQQVIVNKTTGLLVDGHLRVEVAKRRGESSIPVTYVELTEEEEALVLATLDPLSALAGTDAELLGSLVAGITVEDPAIAALLESLTAESVIESADTEGGLTDQDEAPALEQKAVSKRGDVWLLGKHRVMCGSATEDADVAHLMREGMADCLWTDPPYGVSYSQKTRSQGGGSTHRNIENDDLDADALKKFLLAALKNAFSYLGEGCPFYIAYADSMAPSFLAAADAAGFKRQGNVIWIKQRFTLCRTDYQQQHEPILYGWRPGAAHRWHGDRKQRSVQEIAERADTAVITTDDGWHAIVVDGAIVRLQPVGIELQSSVVRVDRPTKNDLHPTMKPVALIEKMLDNSTLPGDVVLDLFGGSGSTLIACAKTGRAARLMELDPLYVDVIVRRWQEYTGKEATREDDGYTFADASADEGVEA